MSLAALNAEAGKLVNNPADAFNILFNDVARLNGLVWAIGAIAVLAAILALACLVEMERMRERLKALEKANRPDVIEVR